MLKLDDVYAQMEWYFHAIEVMLMYNWDNIHDRSLCSYIMVGVLESSAWELTAKYIIFAQDEMIQNKLTLVLKQEKSLKVSFFIGSSDHVQCT